VLRKVLILMAIAAVVVLLAVPLTLTAPVGSGSYAAGGSLPVSWTTNSSVSTSEFSVWAASKVAAVNVRAYGARGDGRTDDSAAFRDAMMAAVRARVPLRVPTGTYLVPRLRLPDRLTIKGASRTNTWLKGEIDFGSNCVVRDLKLGDVGKSTHNLPNASRTLFERCHFRGGGGEQMNAPVIMLGYGKSHSADHITFKDCDIERNMGDEDSDASLGYNDICIYAVGAAGWAKLDAITFDGCHVGVSNGRTDIPSNTGSPRAGLEAYTNPGAGLAVGGWSNLVVQNCVFEITDEFSIDLADTWLGSDTTSRASGPALIKGNLLKGSGLYGNQNFSYPLCIEAPKNVEVCNNTIRRGPTYTIASGSGGKLDWVAPHAYIHDNTIDCAFDNGVRYGDPNGWCALVWLSGGGERFVDNTIITDYGFRILELQKLRDSFVTGNVIRDLRTQNNPWMLSIIDSSNCTVSDNVFWTAATTPPEVHEQGLVVGVDLSHNQFIHQ
jgi:hypothetical protein